MSDNMHPQPLRLTHEQLPESEQSQRRRASSEDARRPTAEAILELVEEHYTLCLSDLNEPFLAPRVGPHVGHLLRTKAFADELSAAALEHLGRTPQRAALDETISTLRGRARHLPAQPLPVRIAEHQGDTIIDLADPEGRCVRIGKAGWSIEDRSPIPFRRTACVSAMPLPSDQPEGSIIDYTGLNFNVAPEDAPLLAAWLACALIPTMQQPGLYLSGEQGSAKTTATGWIGSLIDPGPAATIGQPTDAKELSLLAANSRCLPLDNLSTMPAWLSDHLCRLVTGDALYARVLYSDDDLMVSQSRNVLIVNGIEITPLRGDLASRLLRIDLIPLEGRHQSAREMDAQFRAQIPGFFGAMLDAVVAITAELPKVPRGGETSRLEDFRRAVLAFDRVFSTKAADRFAEATQSLHEIVAGSDALSEAIAQFAESQGEWCGPASALLPILRGDDPPRDFPANATALGARLKRIAPSLRGLGVRLDATHEGTGRSKRRAWRIARIRPSDPPAPAAADPAPATPPPDAPF